MDRVYQQNPAALGVPAPAPRRLVIFRGPRPRRFNGREIGLAGGAQTDDAFGLLHTVTEPVLKDRHHAPRGFFLGRDDPVDFGERADQGLLADDLLAGRERRQDLLEVECCGCTDVDNVDVVHPQQFVERAGAP